MGVGKDPTILANYSMSCPHGNMIGLFYCPVPAIAHDTPLSEDEVIVALDILEDLGFAHYEDGWVWVVSMVTHQITRSPKALRGAANQLEDIPDGNLKDLFVDRWVDTLSIPYRHPIRALTPENCAPVDKIQDIPKNIPSRYPIDRDSAFGGSGSGSGPGSGPGPGSEELRGTPETPGNGRPETPAVAAAAEDALDIEKPGLEEAQPHRMWLVMKEAFETTHGAPYPPDRTGWESWYPFYTEQARFFLAQGNSLEEVNEGIMGVWRLYMREHKGSGLPSISGMVKAWGFYYARYMKIQEHA